MKLAEEPDLVLLCRGTELLVSSQKLAAASPVFSAMFQPNFMEGRELHAAMGPALPVITLPDDPILSIKALCRAVHHSHTDHLPLNSEAVLAFAVTVDKYQCAQSIRAASFNLLEKLPANELPFDLNLDDDEPGPKALMTQAAYLLDSPEHFQRYTHALVLSGRWSILGHGLSGTFSNALSGKHQHLGHRHIRALTARTDKIIDRATEVREHVYREVAWACGIIAYYLAKHHERCGEEDERGNCKASSKQATNYHKTFVELELWPTPEDMVIDPALEIMVERIIELDPSSSYISVTSCEKEAFDMEEVVKGLQEDIGNM